MSRGGANLFAETSRPAQPGRDHADPTGAEREFAFTTEDFEFLRGLIKSRTGIKLGQHKREMVYGRLARRLRALELDSFDAYCRFVNSEEGANELLAMVNAITTNLTKFFREAHHLDLLTRRVLPDIAARQSGRPKPRLRLWSAGCSSGEEPYSVAMTVLGAIPDLHRWDARMLATDLDTEMIRRAKAGRYDAAAFKTIPPQFRGRFAMRAKAEDASTVEMAEELKRFIVFKPLNLLEQWPMKGPFDAIFCRNVVIYFDRTTRMGVFSRFADILGDGGYLFIGHAESLLGLSDRFELVDKTTYRKVK